MSGGTRSPVANSLVNAIGVRELDRSLVLLDVAVVEGSSTSFSAGAILRLRFRGAGDSPEL